MSFDPKAINGISEKVLVSHYENNYVGAVKRLNAIGAQLAELDFAKAPNFVINGLKREELIATNSMILHEIYFDGLGGGGSAERRAADAIARDFGSLERWRAEFAAMGKAEGGGSGWVILSLLAARQAPGQPMGRRPHDDTGRRPAGAGARHVRARLSHGLWRGGGELCRHLHGSDPLGQRGQALRAVQPRDGGREDDEMRGLVGGATVGCIRFAMTPQARRLQGLQRPAASLHEELCGPDLQDEFQMCMKSCKAPKK